MEVADGHHVTAKQEGQVRIKCSAIVWIFSSKRYTNVILEPDECNRLFSIIALMNLGYTCLFHKRFCILYLRSKETNAVRLPHSAQRKHAFWGEIK